MNKQNAHHRNTFENKLNEIITEQDQREYISFYMNALIGSYDYKDELEEINAELKQGKSYVDAVENIIGDMDHLPFWYYLRSISNRENQEYETDEVQSKKIKEIVAEEFYHAIKNIQSSKNSRSKIVSQIGQTISPEKMELNVINKNYTSEMLQDRGYCFPTLVLDFIDSKNSLINESTSRILSIYTDSKNTSQDFTTNLKEIRSILEKEIEFSSYMNAGEYLFVLLNILHQIFKPKKGVGSIKEISQFSDQVNRYNIINREKKLPFQTLYQHNDLGKLGGFVVAIYEKIDKVLMSNAIIQGNFTSDMLGNLGGRNIEETADIHLQANPKTNKEELLNHYIYTTYNYYLLGGYNSEGLQSRKAYPFIHGLPWSKQIGELPYQIRGKVIPVDMLNYVKNGLKNWHSNNMVMDFEAAVISLNEINKLKSAVEVNKAAIDNGKAIVQKYPDAFSY